MQRWRGQRSQVGPVVEAAGQEALWVEALEVRDGTLQESVTSMTGKEIPKICWTSNELLQEFAHLP